MELVRKLLNQRPAHAVIGSTGRKQQQAGSRSLAITQSFVFLCAEEGNRVLCVVAWCDDDDDDDIVG